ncbi:MAG: hypothetical protein DK841_06120 [Candidatus Melainabacteria bacterium]|nr:MAG: hypothetical protein DK841_06120 [Candidatus Melainabacteria bacterium]
MSINAPSSAQVSSTSASSQINSASNSDSAKKTSSESSFKDEMDKVSSTEKSKKNEKTSDEKNDKVDEVSQKDEKTTNTENNANQNQDKNDAQSPADQLNGMVDFSNFGSLSVSDVNSMLTNDIAQMLNINNTAVTGLAADMKVTASGMMNLDYSSISMTESDADFFINLTQKNDVSVQNITAQAQNMLNQGVEAKEVKQNVQISETLLNAINIAKENNQPLRIDFDQNMSVIMRFGKDGAIAANFIPGDKAVEQYLRNNIESLKNTFRENDLPYSDLSYSNRGGKQQKENRRNREQ